VTIRNGQRNYVRDGQFYPHGFLGVGLQAAVSGNRAAMAGADEYRSCQLTGLIATILGLVGVTAGSSWLGYEAGNNGNVALPLVVTLGGLAAILVGGGYTASAKPYRWDAINLFNDGPAMAPGATPRAGSPAPGHASTAKVSLEMRGN